MILVTGGTGLVGTHLLVELLRQGAPVRATYREGSDLARLERQIALQYPEVATQWSDIEWVLAPLSDIPALEEAVDGVLTVYHCAAMIDFDPRQADKLLKVNWEGTRNLVDVALAAGVQSFCYTSSIAAIGGLGPTISETDSWDPNRTNDYGTSKHLGEMEVWRGGQEGMNIVIVNPGTILGPGDWNRGSGRIFLKVSKGLPYSIPGESGFVGVWDVVRCMKRLTEEGHFGKRYLLIAENLSYHEVFSSIAIALGSKPPTFIIKNWQLKILWRLDWLISRVMRRPRELSRDMTTLLMTHKVYDNSRVRNTLGFEFEPMEAIIQRCASYYKQAEA